MKDESKEEMKVPRKVHVSNCITYALYICVLLIRNVHQ